MKKYNIFKVLSIVLVLTMITSYFVPATTIGYGSVSKGTAIPYGFADTFMNSITAVSAFASTFLFIISVAILYMILKTTDKYDAIVNNVAYKFQNKKNLFVVLTVLIFGLLTTITGELFSMIVFVPFVINVLEKLGYNKASQVAVTIGSIILGFSGTMYTFYANQMLSTTFEDNLIYKILISIISLISLLVFVLIFNKPEKVSVSKEKVNKTLPVKIIMGIIGLFVILGFTSWSTYFKFTGFDDFLETIKDAKLFKVSVFDALIGQMAQPFGSFQLYNLTVLILFSTVVISLIYRIKIDNIFEAVAKGIRKALPYTVIALIAYTILVNSYQVFYSIAISLVAKVHLNNIVYTSIVSSVILPDASYATQFALTVLSTIKGASNNSLLIQIVFQTIYSLALLVSPTSIILLLALRFNNISYKSWIKYIYKFFVIVFIIDLIILSIATSAETSSIVVLVVLLVICLAVVINKNKDKFCKKTVKKTTVKKEEIKKEEVKKVENKTSNNTKKSNAKKNNSKTKKNNSKSKSKK